MKISLLTLITAVVSIIGGLELANAAETRQPEPSTPRTIVVHEQDAPPIIRAALEQSTLIELPPEEKVMRVFGGDTENWKFSAGHVPSRFLSVKPKVANETTDVHIISDHGNEYSFQLEEISKDSDPHYDAKIFVTPGDKGGKEKLEEAPVFIPAADVKDLIARLQKEADTAKAAEEKTQKSIQTEEEEYKSHYPGTLHFDYTWDQAKGKSIGLHQVWRDDRFTYLRGSFQETPALYEVKDGKGSLVNFDYSSGLYTVPKMLEEGYLAIGKKKVTFRRTGGGN